MATKMTTNRRIAVTALMLLLLIPGVAAAQPSSIRTPQDVPSTVQATAVKAKLVCHGKPAVGIKVKLFDTGRVDSDDLMAEGTTDDNGKFELRGHADDDNTITPKLNIYHDCNYLDPKPCKRKFSIPIPHAYVNDGIKAKRVFDIRTTELSGKFPQEGLDCANRGTTK